MNRRFETLKDDLNGSVISSLNAVNSSLNEANTLLLSAYTIDGEGVVTYLDSVNTEVLILLKH